MNDLDKQIKTVAGQLNARQKRFCEQLSVGTTAGKAMIAAGYAEKSAARMSTRLLKNIPVQEYISLLDRQFQIKHGVKKEEVRQRLLDIADVASDVEGDGYSPNAAVKAVSEVIDLEGHRAPRQHHVVTENINISYSIDVGRTLEGEASLVNDDNLITSTPDDAA